MKVQRKFTVSEVLLWHPCKRYPQHRIEGLWNGRVALTGLEISDLDISLPDKLWALLREQVLPTRSLRTLTCDWAERTLRAAEMEEKYGATIEVGRRFIRGEATHDDLEAARAALPWIDSSVNEAEACAISSASLTLGKQSEGMNSRLVSWLERRLVACILGGKEDRVFQAQLEDIREVLRTLWSE
jgi:hypothetical protein